MRKIKIRDAGYVFNGNSINAKVKKEKYCSGKAGLPYIATKDLTFKGEFDFQNGVQIPLAELDKFKIAKQESVLICAEGGSAGKKIGFLSKNVCFGNKLFAFEPSKEIKGKYVYYYFLSKEFQKDFKGNLKGIIGGVSLKKFKQLEIPIIPLDRQNRIVSKLDKAFEAIDQAIENTEKNIENVEELFQNTRHEILSATKEDWKIQPLREVCVVERGSSPRPIKKFLTDDDDGVNWIKIGDTKNVNKYIFHTNQKITKEGAEKSRRVDSGDFILSNSMSYGKPYIMKTTGYIHDGWFKLKLLEFIDSEYMYHLLSSKNVVEQFHNLANGSVVKNISGDLVKKVLLPIPPKEEQLKITVDLDTLEKHINELKSKYEEKLSNLQKLKMSILEKAFKGELI